MNRLSVRPYRRGNTSARLLARALGAILWKYERSRFMLRNEDTLINWGNKNPIPLVSDSYCGRIYNPPGNLYENKLEFYQLWKNWVPPYTQSAVDALEWLEAKKRVICRTLLNASGGRGITLVDNPEDLVPNALVYVQYIPKMSEFRVHFFQKEIIFVQQKKMRNGETEANFQVRNHDNGFIFAHQDIEVPWQVLEICQEYINEEKLDFGAVDVIFNAKREKAYLLEVNTAPGLTGETTLAHYVEAFQNDLRN